MKALRFNFYRNIGGRLMMWFLILSLVPVIAVGFMNYYVTKGELSRSTNADLLELTRATAETIDDWVQGRIKKLRDYAKNPVLLSGNREQIQALCKMAAENTQDVEMILFADLSGNAITSTGQQVNVADRDYFKAVTGGKEVAVSSLLVSKATGNKVVVIAVPVKGPAGLVGILASTFEPKTLISKIGNIKYGQTGYACMIDSTGVVMAHPDESKVMRENLTRTESESLNRAAEKMLKGGAGVDKYTDEGMEKLVAFSPVKSAGWVVALTAPTREAYTGVNAIARITVLIILMVAVIVFLLSLFVSRQITRPIVKLTEQADQLATGDLRLEIATGFFGELGVLGEALKTMLASTTGVLRSVNDAISSLEGSIKEISAAADDTARASEQVAQTISQVASGAQDMAQYISNISSNTEETANRTGHGEKIMQELASKIRALTERSKAIGEAMTRLTEDAGQITRITDVITGIAEQTNLLALNAAIEAARAGEAGRGFAVVAEEVRKLAENSRKQAEEIARLIAHVTGEVKMSATMIQEVVNLVEEEVRIGEEALAEFAEIARGAREIAEFLNNIAATSEENAASAEEIAASAQEMSSATQNISASARNLIALMERLKEQAQKFKL